jgi:hypothetical protein
MAVRWLGVAVASRCSAGKAAAPVKPIAVPVLGDVKWLCVILSCDLCVFGTKFFCCPVATHEHTT